MNKTAVIYSRVSSLGERQSNERQIEDLKILGKQKNYTIEKIYEEKSNQITEERLPLSNIAKIEGVGISTVMRLKKEFCE